MSYSRIIRERVRNAGLRKAVQRPKSYPRVVTFRPRWWLWWSPKAWRQARLAEDIVNYQIATGDSPLMRMREKLLLTGAGFRSVPNWRTYFHV